MDAEEFNRIYRRQKKKDELIEVPDDFESQTESLDDDDTLEYRREELARARTEIIVRRLMNGGIDEKKLSQREREAVDGVESGVTGLLDAQLGRTEEGDSEADETESDDEKDTEQPETVERDDEGFPEDASDYQGECVQVRILEDLEPVQGLNGVVYALQEEDVASMPKPNAEALLEKDAAKRVHPSSDKADEDAAATDKMSEGLAKAMGGSD
jgi:DNA replication initiation complex subunit (GINS family)